MVRTGKKPLYSWIKIDPKFLSNSELHQLRLDVENTIRGLARSFDANVNGTLTSYNDDLTSEDYELLAIFHREEQNFRQILYGIRTFPKFNIAAQYRWTVKSISPLDNRSVQKMASHPAKNKQNFAKTRLINFNIPQNKLLKEQLVYVLKRVNYLIQKIENFSGLLHRKVNSQHNSFRDDLSRLKSYKDEILDFLNCSWMRNTSLKNAHEVNLLGNMNYKYIFITKFVKKLRLAASKLTAFHRQYEYYWHRTDLLYEIWGYIQAIKSLENIGFKPIDGWIFNKGRECFDELKDGTAVTMVGDRVSSSENHHLLKIRIIYNQRISANKNVPVWTNGSHNWPDIRVDLYDTSDVDGSKTLIGMLVLDTKYRRLRNVEHDAWDQLASYLDQIKTSEKYAFTLKRYESAKNHSIIDFSKSIVSAVSILYPRIVSDQDDDLVQKFTGKDIIPVGLIPGNGTVDLDSFFNEQISKRIDRVDHWTD
ncbi:hypothetical protein LBSP_22030 [Lentilactobacillus buchneri subsp. silagei]|uniref:nuclease domain-containing protein n=1 Tax=Lentilactobacillus buchneri TaxID=1581 RepID=UPI0012E64E1D|nr:nuclease domain-containing protein [Lentilactobacillus buchneri]GED95643.1 hypothetical protein LBSP_22030 [Lentilactobacillus buchneri subsp. silagei]